MKLNDKRHVLLYIIRGGKIVLEGKRAIITGTNRGIGKAIMEKFASEGADIWACARTPSEEFERNVKELAEKNDVCITPVYFDLEDEEAIKKAIKSIISEKKSIDVLVNNAGIAYGGLMQMTPIDKLKQVFQINYFAPVLMMQLVSRVMQRQKSGSIINIASVGGIETNPGYLAYGSSKASLIWATQSAAKELGAYNIRVNAVAPGLTDTAMGNYKSEEEMNKTIERTGLKRMAQPYEIANAVAFLASDEASYITGEIMKVDGGRA